MAVCRSLLEPGRASDARSPITEFACRRVACRSLTWATSPSIVSSVWSGGGILAVATATGTTVYDAAGNLVTLGKFLAENAVGGVVDMPLRLGEKRCRAGCWRFTSRRKSLRCGAKATKNRGITAVKPSQEYLEFWNGRSSSRTAAIAAGWKEVVVLYRARWQIERLFKLWKSHNRLADRNTGATPAQQLAELYARLIAMVIQHGLLLMTVWPDGRRSLWRAAVHLRDCIGQIIAIIDDTAKLQRVLHRQCQPWANRRELTLDENIRVVSNC